MLATGCVEQPMVFRNNDLPGVMLASAAQRLHAALGRRAGPAGGGGDRQRARLRARHWICSMPASPCRRCSTCEPSPAPAAARDELIGRGVRVRDGWTVVEALPGRAGASARGVR